MRSDLAISAIIPVYNGARFLADAVASIRRQSHPVLEILIVDDGSTDDTPTVAAGLGGEVRYVRQPNGGPPVARNHGLRLARGDVIGFLDVDDLWSDDKLDLQLPKLTGSVSTEVVLGLTQALRPTGSVHGDLEFEPLGDPWTCPQLGSALFRRAVFDRVGFFDETQRYDDDVDWFLRAAELGVSVVSLPNVTVFYRRHDQNLTNVRSVDLHFLCKAVKKSLDRRRLRPGDPATPLPPWVRPDRVPEDR